MSRRAVVMTASAATVASLIALAGAAHPLTAQQEDVEERTGPVLYERLGGERSIRATAAELVRLLQADDELSRYLPADADADAEGVRSILSEEICALAGGPCRRRLPEARALAVRHGLTLEHWDRGVDHLAASLRTAGVPRLAREALLTEVANRRARLAGEIALAEEARRVSESIGRAMEGADPEG